LNGRRGARGQTKAASSPEAEPRTPRYFFKFETEEIRYEDPRRGTRSSNGYETALTIESMRANLRGKYLDDWLRAEREVE
jgi:hypothetical protein